MADDRYVNFLNKVGERLGPKGARFSEGILGSNPNEAAMDLFNQAVEIQKNIGTTPPLDPKVIEGQGYEISPTGRGAVRRMTPEQRETAGTYAKYSTVREKLKSTFKDLGRPVTDEDLGKAVDDSLREVREKQYAAPSAAPSASPSAPPSASPSASPSDLPAGFGAGSALFPEGIGKPDAARLGAGSALFPDGIEMPAGTSSAPASTPAASPAASPAAPAAGRDINALFAKAMGTSFDPKSRMDIAKKQELEALLKGSPDLAGKSDTQVALQYYRQQANAKRK